MSTENRSSWRVLPLSPPPGNDQVLAEILDGGQSFRWYRIEVAPSVSEAGSSSPRSRSALPPEWFGIWADNAVTIRLSGTRLEYQSAIRSPQSAIEKYWDAGRDYAAIQDSLPWRTDAHLACCLKAFPGLRILRQPFGETLLGFLCSATKQIAQIKQMVALLAERFGEPLELRAESEERRADPQAARLSALGSKLFANRQLPTWKRLAAVPERELRSCKLGFRAGFISDTARFLAARPGWLEETEALPYAEAKARLCELPGVGEKIADCVLLYGAGKLEAFPVDTWILKAMARRYGLDGWKPAQVAHFGRTHFGPHAGLAQQYLFNYERAKRL